MSLKHCSIRSVLDSLQANSIRQSTYRKTWNWSTSSKVKLQACQAKCSKRGSTKRSPMPITWTFQAFSCNQATRARSIGMASTDKHSWTLAFQRMMLTESSDLSSSTLWASSSFSRKSLPPRKTISQSSLQSGRSTKSFSSTAARQITEFWSPRSPTNTTRSWTQSNGSSKPRSWSCKTMN